MPTQSKVRHGTLLTFAPVVPCGSHPAPPIGQNWTLLDTFGHFFGVPIPPPPTVIPAKAGIQCLNPRTPKSAFVRICPQKPKIPRSNEPAGGEPVEPRTTRRQPPTANRHPRESGDPVPQPAHTKVRFCPDLSAKTKNVGAPTSPLLVSLSNHEPPAANRHPRESGDPVPQPPHTIVRLCPDLSAKTKNSALKRVRCW